MSNGLQSLTNFLQTQNPLAIKIERESVALKRLFQTLLAKKLTGIFVEKPFSLLSLNNSEQIEWLCRLATFSYTLAFMCAQHETALSIIDHSNNKTISEKWLNEFRSKQISFGIAIAHLRFTEKPMLIGKATEDGYILNGKVSWVTGYKIFDYLVLGFQTTDNQEIYSVQPFTPSSSFDCSAPFDLFSCKSTNTVSITFKNHLVPSSTILSQSESGDFKTTSTSLGKAKPLVTHASLALGVLHGILDVCESNIETIEKLACKTEFETIKTKAQQLLINLQNQIEEAIVIRAKALTLAHKSLLLTTVLLGGQSVLINSVIPRITREITLCSVAALGNEYKKLLFTS